MARKKTSLPTTSQIKEFAKVNNDIDLAFAYGSIEELYKYMENKLSSETTEYLPWVSDEAKAKAPMRNTVISRVKANSKRYTQLQNWLKDEKDDTYKAFYKRESVILRKYILTLIGEMITNKPITEDEAATIADDNSEE